MTGGRKLLGRGTVLVDPRAAVAKLRSYQLGEPVMYVLELVRAAVAGGATAIDLENDADDFVLTFDGEPLDADELSRLLDFLLSGANPRLRLVAIAVNTALGFSPTHIDLYTTRFAGAPADGSVVARVRWGARSQRAGAIDQGVIERVARPAKMPSPGMRVHVREAFGVAVMREWFRAAPAETDLLRERVVALPVPLTRNGVALTPRDARPPIASVPLALSGDLRGALHLVDAQHPSANTLVFCERGVALETVALREPDAARGRLPLRMILDADALPTNAARSKVTLSAGLRGAARRAWREGVAALVEAALALTTANGDAGLRAAEALAALVRAEAGDGWHGGVVARPDADAIAGPAPDAVIARLLDAPIVPTATGSMASLRAVAAWSPRHVWNDARPLAPDLARWVRNVVWSRDDRPALAALLASLPMESASVAVQRAQEAQARHARFLAQPEGDPVTALRDAALRRPFGDPSVHHGELAVAARALLRPGEMKVTPWIERRPLGAESVGIVQVACEVALAAPGLRALPEFDGVARDDTFTAGVASARAALVEGLTALVMVWQSAMPDSDSRASWVGPAARDLDGYAGARVARAVLAEARALAPEDKQRETLVALLTRHPALADAPAWSTTDDERFVSTRSVLALAEKAPHALLVAPPSAKGSHPAGLPVLTPDDDDRATLAALCPARARLVEYAPYLAPPSRRRVLDALSDPSLVDALPWITVEGDGARMAVAPAPQAGRGALTLVHAGRALGSRAHATPFGHALIVLEDDGLIPDPAGGGALAGALSREGQRLLDGAGIELARALADALNGARKHPAMPDDEQRHVATLRFLLAALAAAKRAPEHAALGEAIQRAPLVPIFDASDTVRRTSIDALSYRLGEGRGALPVLRQAPANVDGEGFEPLILPSQDLVDALARASGLALADASAQLPHRKGDRARRRARAALEARPRAELDALAELGAVGPAATASIANLGAVAIAPAADADGARAQCLFDGVVTIEHAPVRVLYPAVVRVALAHERLLRTSLDALTPTGEQAVERLIEAGALALVARLAAAAHNGDVGDAARAFLVSWVGHKGRRGLNEDPALREALARAPLWRSPDGRLLDVASRATPVACVRSAPAGWLAPAADEPADPDYLCIFDDAWVRCIAAIGAGAAHDATQAALTAQRARRLRARGVASVRLDGDAPAPSLAARIEAHAPALGYGELRVVDGPPGITVSLFVEGARPHRASLRAPFAVEVALASPAIEPARAAESFQQLDALPKLLGIVRALAEHAATSPQRGLPWVRRVVRWWLLTTPNLDDAARALAAFVDSAGRPMSLDDCAAQLARFNAVAYATEGPAEPCEPLDEGRRVVMLEGEEARWLNERWSALNYTLPLHEDAAARSWEREAPRAKITVDAALPDGAQRVPLRGDDLEGEVALAPPGVAGEGALVQWFVSRRPLGNATLDAPWHCLVAVEARGLTPNRRRSAPVEGDGYRRACEAVTQGVLRALDDALPAPADALATAAAHATRSPATTRTTARIAGSLWLSLDDREGALDVRTAAGRERMGRDARLATPVHGCLWVRRAVKDSDRDALLVKTVEWAWRTMLESVVSRAQRDAAFADDPRVVDHLVCAALRGMLTTPKLRTWARLATLPDTAVTYERVAATDRSPLALLDGDAPSPDDDALAVVDAPWFERLVAQKRVMEGAPVELASKHVAPTKPRASRTVAASSMPTQRADWAAGAALQTLLNGARAQGLPPVTVASSQEPVSARRATVAYDAGARTITVFRAHPAVLALDEGDALRAARFLALAAYGAIRRAVGAVTEAHEAGLLEAMLQQMGEERSKRTR